MSKTAGKSKARLCKLAAKRDWEAAAQLASGARYICRKCCRVASAKKNLCKPTRL